MKRDAWNLIIYLRERLFALKLVSMSLWVLGSHVRGPTWGAGTAGVALVRRVWCPSVRERPLQGEDGHQAPPRSTRRFSGCQPSCWSPQLQLFHASCSGRVHTESVCGTGRPDTHNVCAAPEPRLMLKPQRRWVWVLARRAFLKGPVQLGSCLQGVQAHGAPH